MTAQHAQRQGSAVAAQRRRLAGPRDRPGIQAPRSRLRGGSGRLAGRREPAARPLTGVAAKVVTRGYHLYALPANRLRVATDWFNDIVEHRQFVRLGLVQPDRSGLAVAEQTDIYYRTDGQPLDHAAVPPAPDAASP